MRLDRVEHPAVKDLLRLCTTVLPTARATAHGAADAQAVKRWFRLPAATCAAKMRRAFRFAMTTAPGSPSPAAVVAFLRGIDRRARLFATVQAGAGIVLDSVPQSEADETRNKARSVLRAIAQAHHAKETF